MLHTWWLWIALGYLLGSIPFALLIGRARGVDIRKQGSGNIGATNVGRVLGRKWGYLCFVLDVCKGLAPVTGAALVQQLYGSEVPAAQAWLWLAVGGAAVVGHVFPIWLGFRGGKGVATGLGVLLGYWPVLGLPTLVGILIWIGLVKTFRYISLASVGAAVSLPVTLAVVTLARHDDWPSRLPFIAVTLLLALLVVTRHRTNLARLKAGTESKVGSAT